MVQKLTKICLIILLQTGEFSDAKKRNVEKICTFYNKFVFFGAGCCLYQKRWAWGIPYILGFGISLSVIANVIMNSGEAFVKALADTINKGFGNVKIAFDIFCVVFSMILSLLFFNLTISGTREGTIISAFLTGTFVKLFTKVLQKTISQLLEM